MLSMTESDSEIQMSMTCESDSQCWQIDIDIDIVNVCQVIDNVKSMTYYVDDAI